MVRKTKKVSKTGGMTVPQLRKAFQHIESYAMTHSATDFTKEWKKTFGKSISKSAAEDYISFLKSSEHSGKQSGSKQSGGGIPLAGAPLDYTTRAGSDPSTAASVPPYVSSGFGFANIDSFHAMSGKEDITPRIPADMGSNTVGGGRRKTLKNRKTKGLQTGGGFPSLSTAVSEFMSRPFTMNSPPNVLNDLTLAAKGHASDLSSPRPENNNLNLTSKPMIYSANANINRIM